MVLVARLVARLDVARADPRARAAEAQRVIDLSELLVEDRSVDDLLKSVVRGVATLFAVPGVALLVPDGEALRVAASAGEELTTAELSSLEPGRGCRSASGPHSHRPASSRPSS